MIRRSWRNALIALQLLAEERAGAPRRAQAATEEAIEDAAFADSARKAANAR